MTNENQNNHELVVLLLESLPPVIARKDVRRVLGGMISPQTLANADHIGTGPKESYRVGKTIVYRTPVLLDWIVKRYGIAPISKIKPQKGA